MLPSLRRSFAALACAAALVAPAGAAVSGDLTAGERVFNQCRACHTLEPGVSRVGPSLHGVFGRVAGTLEGYAYTEAMKASGIVWSEESLRTYLADPRGTVPGTRMALGGIHDPAKVEDLIAYLLQATE